MTLLTGLRSYYSLLGPFGVFLAAKNRVLGNSIQVAVEIAGIRHPVHLRVRTADIWLCRQILLEGQYESGLSIRPRVIVDAGANIGLATIFYANKYPEAKILAIEPEHSNYEMLRKNVALYPNVIPVQAALWNRRKRLTGSPSVTHHHMFQVREESGMDDEGCCSGIPGVSLQELMTEFEIQQIDLLKVDIEGSEKEVFQGSPEWIQHVGIIAIETHDWIRSGCSESVCNAATDFEFKWQHGETTYFARTGDPPTGQMHLKPDLSSPNASQCGTSRYPMKIIQII
jgi:FkbM family methyltransferase